ncbi:hypothetical protein [Arsenicicoccus sp. oral taxon 190]|uniref:hypothetical protein n=1 Tax=Arsenicicoccus sp. oral taxon 190 TaxID=1658671 RepID=UPI0009E1C989|nr:hypothetical protein [Arsenicicoccus sp. oral taxon 190]
MRPTPAVAVTALCAATLLACSAPAHRPPTTSAGSPTAEPQRRWPALPDRVFAETSFWYHPLPRSTPTDPRSADIVRDLHRAAVEHGDGTLANVGINTADYSPPLVTVPPDAPTVDVVAGPGCSLHPEVAATLRGIRVPADLRPAGGSDAEVTLFDPQARRYTDLWRVRRDGQGRWTACGGGSIANPRRSDGRFPFPIGTTATGLPFGGGMIRVAELQRGHIDHVLGLAVPYAASAPAHSWPASRSDGRNPRGYQVLRQGQRLRLPADLDLDSLRLSRTARVVAQAAQDYGLVVWDTAGNVSLRAENPSAFVTDPYPGLFGVATGWEALHGDPGQGEQPFPLERLEVLPVDYGKP